MTSLTQGDSPLLTSSTGPGLKAVMVALARFTHNTEDAVFPPVRVRPPVPSGPPTRRVTELDKDRIVQLYASGMDGAEVAEETGRARSTVMRVLRERDVGVRPWGVHKEV